MMCTILEINNGHIVQIETDPKCSLKNFKLKASKLS